MKAAQSLMLIMALLIFTVQLATLNYDNLQWSANTGHYIGMIAMACVAVSMTFSILYNRRKK